MIWSLEMHQLPVFQSHRERCWVKGRLLAPLASGLFPGGRCLLSLVCQTSGHSPRTQKACMFKHQVNLISGPSIKGLCLILYSTSVFIFLFRNEKSNLSNPSWPRPLVRDSLSQDSRSLCRPCPSFVCHGSLSLRKLGQEVRLERCHASAGHWACWFLLAV